MLPRHSLVSQSGIVTSEEDFQGKTLLRTHFKGQSHKPQKISKILHSLFLFLPQLELMTVVAHGSIQPPGCCSVRSKLISSEYQARQSKLDWSFSSFDIRKTCDLPKSASIPSSHIVLHQARYVCAWMVVASGSLDVAPSPPPGVARCASPALGVRCRSKMANRAHRSLRQWRLTSSG